MPLHRSKLIYINKKKWYVPAVSIISSFAVIGALLALFSFLMTKIDFSNSAVSLMGMISICAGGFSAGFITGKNKRRGGIKNGIKYGLIIYVILLFFGTIIMKRLLGLSMLGKLIVICICSAIGGICGVNTKIRKPPV